MNVEKQPLPYPMVVRLPHALAAQLERKIPPHERDGYFSKLVQRDLERREKAERRQLIEAAEYMNRLEAENPELAREAQEWVDAKLTTYPDDEDDFDPELFERQFAEAQARHGLSRPK